MDVIKIAQVCHDVNKSFCESVGDMSQLSWNDAPDWAKSSAINGVTFHILHPDALPSHSHEEWMKEKIETGWVYGEVKDAEKKTHPCIVAYDQLPTVQKSKDYLFKQVVNSLKNL